MRILLLGLLLASAAQAAEVPSIPVESAQLQKCLKRADELPDMAAVEAQVWIKKNGGNDAHLCRAFAQANRGMHADSAREFWALASFYDKRKNSHALMLHNLSGQEFLRAKDIKNAAPQYDASLKISPGDITALTGRAETRMDSEHYWEAIDDLNRALKIDPNNVNALRQRGRAWAQLGNKKNAAEDFARAEEIVGKAAK